ncbi:hypothetical protein OIU84_027932 [Salix udensis]|uniref:Uncharacterized protein n=1 Tax=Salix udensis TaxID=889485 RepID=A0AAD6P914_9ROSI|nr:hypothetical protein OIU84_027932 [Salix udensis]
MKFTDSPEINLKIKDKTLSLQQDNSSFHVGTSIWSGSLVLSKFLDRWTPLSTSPATTPTRYSSLLNFHNRRAIELGTGCGVTGMALYLLGLADIVLTDIHPRFFIGVTRIKLMGSILPFDYVIAADVVYIEESVGALVKAMEMLVKDDGVVLLGYQLRSPEADKLFWETLWRGF